MSAIKKKVFITSTPALNTGGRFRQSSWPEIDKNKCFEFCQIMKNFMGGFFDYFRLMKWSVRLSLRCLLERQSNVRAPLFDVHVSKG